MTQFVDRFKRALLSLDRFAAKALFEQQQEKYSPVQFAEQIVVPALEDIGAGWERGDIALAQVYMSGRICEELMDELLPADSAQRKNQPVMALTILEDYHLLGKRMVSSILRANGFELTDYGQTSVDELVKRVIQSPPDILLISTLMLPSALRVKAVREKLEAAGVAVKIVVGGAPFRFDETLWHTVGADAMARNASDVITIIDQVSIGS